MSKKKAVNYDLSYIHFKSRPEYIKIDFIDKKGRTMMSSVDVLINLEYFDAADLDGFVYAR
tara:strand:- start:642 stop:824 length:183 start_codon:yes stop_codon:yes gene_type:complete